MHLRTASAITTLALVTAACPGLFGPGQSDGPLVTVQVDRTTVSPSQPLVATVTASNPGTRRVTWGPGSSTCQLGIAVRVDGEDRAHPGSRPCTGDYTTHSLEPGQSRTETFPWDGRVATEAGFVTLEPGTYELRGVALPATRSAPVTVTVVPD